MLYLAKIVVTGDRDGYDQDVIDADMAGIAAIAKNPDRFPFPFPPGSEASKFEFLIICGGAPGVDTQCELAAKKQNLHTARVDALWGTRHRGAGPQRNEVMAAMEPAMCYAYHHKIAESTGTLGMVKLCHKLGVEITTRGFELEDVV